MAEGGRDQPETEVEELRRRLREAELLRDENEELKRQLTALSDRHEEDMDRLLRQQPVVNVKVAAPTLLPRLKTFTGLAPTGGSEVAFSEWENQAEQVLGDTGVSDPLQTLRSTLRGLALDQVRHCTRVEDLVHRLRHTFGEVKAPDDLYLDFCGLAMNKKELPSEFLLRLWSRLLQINRTTMSFCGYGVACCRLIAPPCFLSQSYESGTITLAPKRGNPRRIRISRVSRTPTR